MKTTLILGLTAAVIQLSCSGKPETIDFAKEEAAIKEVIASESRAFWEKNYEAWADCWLPADYVRVIGWWEKGGVTVYEGWERISGEMSALMDKYPEPNPQNEINENFNVRISNTMAWVTFDQIGSDTGEDAMDMPGKVPNTRVLEKVNGKWKLVYVGWILPASNDNGN